MARAKLTSACAVSEWRKYLGMCPSKAGAAAPDKDTRVLHRDPYFGREWRAARIAKIHSAVDMDHITSGGTKARGCRTTEKIIRPLGIMARCWTMAGLVELRAGKVYLSTTANAI